MRSGLANGGQPITEFSDLKPAELSRPGQNRVLPRILPSSVIRRIVGREMPDVLPFRNGWRATPVGSSWMRQMQTQRGDAFFALDRQVGSSSPRSRSSDADRCTSECPRRNRVCRSFLRSVRTGFGQPMQNPGENRMESGSLNTFGRCGVRCIPVGNAKRRIVYARSRQPNF